nr:hypothetical protein [Tanacetum cinerariifolium]
MVTERQEGLSIVNLKPDQDGATLIRDGLLPEVLGLLAGLQPASS